MKLDHHSLEPFEPTIKDLMKSAYGDALRGLASTGLKPGDEWHTEANNFFKASCLPSFRTVQEAIALSVLDLENRLIILKKEGTTARENHNKSTVKAIMEIRLVIQNRQLLLRRFVDGIIWTLFWPNKWILRRLRLEGGKRRTDAQAIGQMLKAVKLAHSEDNESAWLISDLSTLVQIGDLIIAHWKPSQEAIKITIAEKKVGPKNVLLHKRLHDPKITDLNTEIAKISAELGAATAAQASRMARQEKRLKDFKRVIVSDEGVHPVSGQKYRMTKSTYTSKDYRDKIHELISWAKIKGLSSITLDGSLHLLATKHPPDQTNDGLMIAHEFYHMRDDHPCDIKASAGLQQNEMERIINGPKIINLFDFNINSSIALPPFLWYPCETVMDVVFGKVRIFAQFDHERFFNLALESGLKMHFVCGSEAGRIKSAKISGPLVEYNDPRYVKAENTDGKVMLFGARFFTRVYTEHVRPFDMLEMIHTLIQEAEPRLA